MVCPTDLSGAHSSLHLRWITLIHTPDALFWDTIFSMDVTSTEDHLNIATLLSSPSKIIDAINLQGDQAQRFIDLIDQVSDSANFLPSAPRALIIRYSFSCYHTLIRSYLGGVHGCFTRSAKLAGYYPPHTFFSQSPPILVNLSGAAALRM